MKNYRRALGAAIITTGLTLGATTVSDSPLPAATAQAQQLPQLSSLPPELQKLINLSPAQLEKVGILVALVAALIVLGPVTGTLGSSSGGESNGGDTHRRTIRAGGRERSYVAVLPAGYDNTKSYPIMIGYGGWQHTADQMRGYANLDSAVAGQAIVVYAQGVDNAWAGAPYARTSTQDDIDYTRTLIDDVAQTFGGDRTRVTAVGLSNGGGMVANLACHAPELLKGVVSVAGAYYNPTVNNCSSTPVATLLIHGTNDNVVGYNGGVRHGAGYKSVPEVFATFTRKNSCVTEELPAIPEGNVTRFSPAGCISATELLRVESGGHTWFERPDATELAVDFLLNRSF